MPFILILAGIGFFFKGRVLPEGSEVFHDDMGEGSSALYCLTDRELCCSTEAGANRGRWDSPNGGSVGNSGTLYASRGFSSLLLNKRSSAVVPTGVYTCLIPDAAITLRMLQITIRPGGEFTRHCSLWIDLFRSDELIPMHSLYI